jgi:hypothetical protein
MIDPSPSMRRIADENALDQLLEKRGRMAELGSENGKVMLDWVDGLPRLLAIPGALEAVEEEARGILDRGIQTVIWAGMGGSVMAVRVLTEMLAPIPDFSILPLDSTDPATLNAIVLRLAADKGLHIAEVQEDAASLRLLFDDVLMVGVAMGMTSEEPITHLQWFVDLLAEAGLRAEDHTLVTALPGSYLEEFAREHRLPVVPLQLDGGNGTGGRMSAPTTRVFLLPAALLLAANGEQPGALRRILRHVCEGAAFASEGGAHSSSWAAALMAEASQKGVCRLLLDLRAAAVPLFGWIEQLMEESLGKGGLGVIVFDGPAMPWMDEGSGVFRPDLTWVVGEGQTYWPLLTVLRYSAEVFLKWQFSMALYGYLYDIPFAGQPAVENYKSRARALRESGDPLSVVREWEPRVEGERHTVVLPTGAKPFGTPAESVAQSLRRTVASGDLLYLDVTMNGEWPSGLHEAVMTVVTSAAERLRTCFKVRRAPAAYHSTEQSEMDGPPGVFSIRVVTREHEKPLLGSYGDTFLLAQAVGTWGAMNEAGRQCCLAVFEGTPNGAAQTIVRFLTEALEV